MRREADREASGARSPGIGVVSRESFAAGAGPMIVLRPGVPARVARWPDDEQVALLLVAAGGAPVPDEGWSLGELAAAVRGGRMQAYFLCAMDGIEDAGLAAFVEDLGLAFPRH